MRRTRACWCVRTRRLARQLAQRLDRPGACPGARRVGAHAIATLVLLVAGAPGARAQDLPLGGPRAELRLDVRPFNAAELGVGVAMPTSLYARLGARVSAGAQRDGDSTRAVGRLEAFVRIPFDPLFEGRWAPYVTTGAALACADARRCAPFLALRVGLEGPRGTSGWVPAVEAGVGGGAHIALVLRRARGPAR